MKGPYRKGKRILKEGYNYYTIDYVDEEHSEIEIIDVWDSKQLRNKIIRLLNKEYKKERKRTERED